MTDTLAPTKTRKPRGPAVPVDYVIEALAEPPKQTRVGVPRSPVHDQVQAILSEGYPPNQWFTIARYPGDNEKAGQSASAKAGDLRKKYETAEFMVGDHPDGSGDKVIAMRKVA